MAENPFPGMNPYLEQRWGDVHTSLITYSRDMLQDALPVTLAQPQFVPRSKHSPYHACAWRATGSFAAEYYPIWLRDRMPRIRIPLRATDPDVVLDLQELINLCYRRGRYDDIDYSQPLDPPLHPEDMEWVRTLVTDTAGEN